MTCDPLTRRHLIFGWCSLLIFLTLGIGLEALHGLKMRLYLDEAYETRRLMLTLAHAHGALLALVHIGFAATLALLPGIAGEWQRWTSVALVGASILLPGGFLLGGLVLHGGDPGAGIVLAPVGAGLMFAAVARIAWAALRGEPPSRGADDERPGLTAPG